MCEIRVVPPMAASFHSKVGTFAPLRLNKNNYHVRIATTKSLSDVWTWLLAGRPQLDLVICA